MGSDESHVAAIPKQYVVDSMMDVTKIFNGKTRVSLAGGPIFKCCKSRPNDLGLLVDEADEKTHELLQGCRGLVGIRFKSFTRYEEHPENARCLVAKSGMPDAFLQHLYHFPAEVVPVVGELVDVSDVLMKQEKSVTLPSGRTYRCCMKAGDRHAFLVEQRNNALDGTVFQRLQENFAPLSNKKCSGLVAVGYSSWKKWAGNRCIVQSSHIPQEAMKLLGWTLLATISKESPIPEADGPVNTEELRTSTPKPKRQLTNQISTITDEIEEFDVPAVANGDNVNDVALQGEQELDSPSNSTSPNNDDNDNEDQELDRPSPSPNNDDNNNEEQQASTETGAPPAPLAQQTASVPAPAPAPSSNWQLTLRVVSATTGKMLKSVPVQILNRNKALLAEGTTSEVGIANFMVPRDEDMVFLVLSKNAFTPMKRRYIRSRQCGDENSCTTQCALSPKF